MSGDLSLIRKGGEEMLKICDAEAWRTRDDQIYSHYRGELRRGAMKLMKQADDQNLDGAALHLHALDDNLHQLPRLLPQRLASRLCSSALLCCSYSSDGTREHRSSVQLRKSLTHAATGLHLSSPRRSHCQRFLETWPPSRTAMAQRLQLSLATAK